MYQLSQWYNWLTEFATGPHEALLPSRSALARTDDAPSNALQRLRDLLEAHMTTQGVLFDSRAWIIIAHRGQSR